MCTFSLCSDIPVCAREVLVKKSSSQPSSPVSSSQPPQFPGQFSSHYVVAPPSPRFDVCVEICKSPNELLIDGKSQDLISISEFYCESLKSKLLEQLSVGFESNLWRHVSKNHIKIVPTGGDQKSQFKLSLPEVQATSKSVVKHPNLIVKCDKADFVLVGNFSKVIGQRHWSGVTSDCWCLSIVVRDLRIITIIPIINQFTIPHPKRIAITE